MLAFARDSLAVDEPFNLSPWAYRLGGHARYWFTYAPGLPFNEARVAFDRVITRKTGRVFPRRTLQRYLPWTRKGRLIVKDPIACFSSEWLHANYDMRVVIVARHPAAFAASLKRLNWTFSFENLLQQRVLMDHHLAEFEGEMRSAPDQIVEQAALIWKIIYTVLFRFLNSHPDWILVKHERLSESPVEEFNALYSRLGLDWTRKTAMQIESYTSSRNPVDAPGGVADAIRRNSYANIDRWKSILSADEVQRVFKTTRTIATPYYGLGTWG